ncbi:MAG: transglutaminase-like domain-containing protein [Clostridiales bacterium]|nr:transglutaminase-like domain-containing protein [Clostridiales bacterium]
MDNHTGFHLRFQDEDRGDSFAQRYITALFLFCGTFCCLWFTLGLNGLPVNLIVLSAAGGAYCAIGCGLKGRWRFLYVVATAAPIVLLVTRGIYVLEGWNATSNQIFLTLEGYLGRILPRYEVSETLPQILCLYLFLLLPTVALGELCGRVAGGGRTRLFVSILLVPLLWIAALFLRAPLPLAGAAVLVAAGLVLAGRRLPVKSILVDGRKFFPRLLALTAALILIALIPALLLRDIADATSARRAAAQMIHGIRYEWNGRILPEGDFRRQPDTAEGDARMYWAVLESEKAHYFRGFVGESYTGSGWAQLSAEQRAEYATLFAWLHGRGFYGQNQYASLADALGLPEDVLEIQVDNAEAHTGYLYTPYELTRNAHDSGRIGDESLPAGGLRGEAAYTLALSGGSALDDEGLYRMLASAYRSGNPAAMEYLTAENAYRSFVYDNYLDLPDTARAAIARFLAGLELPAGELSFPDAKLVVNAYLSTLGYTNALETPWPGVSSGDFLTYFLEGNREGSSIYFATAATLMFRYLGIPARYVEGFRFTRAELEAASANGPVSLGGANAGAWAEVYRDGVGFVPFVLNPPDLHLPDQEWQSMEQEYIPPEGASSGTLADWQNYFLRILGALLILLLAAALALVIRRALIRRRLRKRLSVSDNAIAVSRITAYLVGALSYAGVHYQRGSLFTLRPALDSGFDRQLGEEYEAVIRIQQAALFSGRETADGDRAQVEAFLGGFLDRLKERASTVERLRLTWVACVL